MRRAAGCLVAALVCPSSVLAQEQDRSVARISLALREPSRLVAALPPETAKAPTRLGIFTLVPPTGRGEMIRVSIPIGEMVSRVFEGASSANRRRQEVAARREVESALQAWFESRPPPKR
jgi:hypothetical protein